METGAIGFIKKIWKRTGKVAVQIEETRQQEMVYIDEVERVTKEEARRQIEKRKSILDMKKETVEKGRQHERKATGSEFLNPTGTQTREQSRPSSTRDRLTAMHEEVEDALITEEPIGEAGEMPYKVGDEIEGFFQGDWYDAVVLGVFPHREKEYDVKFEGLEKVCPGLPKSAEKMRPVDTEELLNESPEAGSTPSETPYDKRPKHAS